MSTAKEFRSVAASLRAESQGDEMSMSLVGYAALFNSESKDLGGFRERIAPGAFTRSLKEQADVKALVNHDPNQVLGRTKNGTLTLSEDDRGLKFRVKLNPAIQAHRDLYALIKNGTMDECSFAMTVPAGGDSWEDAKDENGITYALRTLHDVTLMDVSAVTYPAYNATSVAARSMVADYSEKRKGIKRVDEGDTYARARRTLEQLGREEFCAELNSTIERARKHDAVQESDAELAKRMRSAAGISTR